MSNPICQSTEKSNKRDDSARPLIYSLKNFVVELASAVTVASESRSDWVARKGPNSLFHVMSRMLPQVCCELLIDSSNLVLTTDHARFSNLLLGTVQIEVK